MKKTRLTLIAVVWTLSLVGVGLWAQGTAASPQQPVVVPQGLGDRAIVGSPKVFRVTASVFSYWVLQIETVASPEDWS